MAGGLVKEIRIEQTRRQLVSLHAEIQAWLCERRKKDELRKQYHTQLKVLEKALLSPLATLIGKIDATDDTFSTGEVYAICRARDQQMLLVRRVWTYFREKFDQRDDSRYQLVLQAADEVVWSCYTEVFRNLNAYSQYKAAQGSVPLPYIESEYSPQARPRDDARLPPDLKPDTTDDVLYGYLSQMPVPLVSLPPACVQEPWWLIHLGHEVGHHLQHDLVPHRGLVNSFGNLLQTVALNPPDPVCDSREARHWFDWKEEIFADLCAIFSMGTWAINAMVELERASVRDMFVSRTSYPPSIVRLELMAQVGEALGLNGYTALGDLQPKAMIADKTLEEVADLRIAASKDLQMLPKMVAAMLGPFPLVGRFTEFYRWNKNAAYFRAGGTVARLVVQLLGTEKLYPDQTLESARLLTSAALAAWSQVSIATQDATQRNQARERLAERFLPSVIQSREVGVRATIPVAEPDITGLDERLIDILFREFPDQIE